MTARSNGAHQGHFTRHNNAGQTAHYTPVLCTIILRNSTELSGYVWVNGLRYSPTELHTYLLGIRAYEPERWDALTLAVGMDRETVQTFSLNDVQHIRRNTQQ